MVNLFIAGITTMASVFERPANTTSLSTRERDSPGNVIGSVQNVQNELRVN